MNAIAPATHITKQNHFDALRLAAAAMVVFSHCLSLYGVDEHSASAATELLFKMRGIGVGMFFSISGYLITRSYLTSDGLKGFARKRFLRIYPALIGVVIIAAVVLCALSTLPAAQYYTHPQFARYLGNALFILPGQNVLPGVFTDNPHGPGVNSPLWTIRMELLLYAIIGALGAMGWLRRSAAIGMAALCSVGLLAALGGFRVFPAFFQEEWLAAPALRHSICFFIGSYLCLSGFKTGNPRIGGLLFLLIFAAMLYTPLRYASAFLIPFATLHLAFSNPSGPTANLGKYGDYSYGLYIYSFPVQQALMQLWGGQMALWAYILLSFLLTGALAFASWHLLEKRMLRLKAKTRPPLDRTGEVG